MSERPAAEPTSTTYSWALPAAAAQVSVTALPSTIAESPEGASGGPAVGGTVSTTSLDVSPAPEKATPRTLAK